MTVREFWVALASELKFAGCQSAWPTHCSTRRSTSSSGHCWGQQRCRVLTIHCESQGRAQDSGLWQELSGGTWPSLANAVESETRISSTVCRSRSPCPCRSSRFCRWWQLMRLWGPQIPLMRYRSAMNSPYTKNLAYFFTTCVVFSRHFVVEKRRVAFAHHRR